MSAKTITFVDTRADSPLERFVLEVPETSPWHELLPDEQTVEIVDAAPDNNQTRTSALDRERHVHR